MYPYLQNSNLTPQYLPTLTYLNHRNPHWITKTVSTVFYVHKIKERIFLSCFKGDPLDNRYVDLKISETYPEAGEGSFAKTRVAKNTIYSLYGGWFFTNKEFKSYILKAEQDFRNRNVSDQEYEDFWKYRYKTENQPVLSLYERLW